MTKNNHENKQKQSTQNVISDGIDEEYSTELADKDDIEAQARAAAADRRAQNKQ